MNDQPIVFANGDGGTGRVARMVRESIFGDFKMVEIPVTVERRIDTNDGCLSEVVDALRQYRAGFKNSTASMDPRIVERDMGSANLVLRKAVGAYAIARLLEGPGRYGDLCGVMRYPSGGFYDEQSCVEKMINGRRTAVITQHMDLDGLEPFARLSMDIAQAKGWHLVLASKSTIATSELWFRQHIERVWRQAGLVEGKGWSRDWHHELSDMGGAQLPVENGEGKSPSAKGKFLYVADNPGGDWSSDIVDHQHGNYVMTSRIHGAINGQEITCEELPGGTADDKATGQLTGAKFFGPAGIIFGIASPLELVNPDLKPFFDAVRLETLSYLAEVPAIDRDTEDMIARIANNTLDLLAA